MNAKVWLVGAGPGDPELLTLKAVRALREADVVLIDDLVNDAVLEHCPGARVIAVGKRGGCRSTPQAFIHRLMLRYARHGKCVVRLKGGDPCIFGRGGEEAQWLRERGVEVELVNGITAGLAGATQCDIPLTLRGVARGVTLVTAHTQDGSSLNWQALAQGGTTLVIYMGVAKLGEIREQLLVGGLSAGTPVAMIENASLPHQRECRSTLMSMEDDALAFQLKSPAILVIGAVAASATQTQHACVVRGLAPVGVRSAPKTLSRTAFTGFTTASQPNGGKPPHHKDNDIQAQLPANAMA